MSGGLARIRLTPSRANEYPEGMSTLTRLVRSAAALAATGLLLVGCAAGADDSAPTSTDDDAATSSPAPAPEDDQDLEAAWLDGGRMFAIVSWGSSTCIPVVDEVSADGQRVSLSLVDIGEADTACTADFAPRASVAALPDGVDPAQDVEFDVTIGDDVRDVELDGADVLGGDEYAASAGWFDDDGIVLLTWGSSTCVPLVQDVATAAGGATVTFAEQDGMCTMDMAPRTTIIELSDDDDADDDAPYTLTLVGGGLDGTVEVIGG